MHQIKSKVLFTTPSKDGVYQISRKKHSMTEIVRHIREKHGAEAIILNVLPEADAIAIYAGAA